MRLKKEQVLKIPMWLTVIYLLSTIVIYKLCPYNWPTKKPLLFYTLLIVYIAAIGLGYWWGSKRRVGFKLIQWDEKKQQVLMTIVSVLITVNFFVYLIFIFRSYGLNSLNFAALWKEMLIGLKNPGLGYMLNYLRQQNAEGSAVLGGTLFTLFNLGWAFVKVPSLLIGIVHFKQMRLFGKIFLLSYFAVVVVFYISIGTNIQFLHVLLMILLPVVLHFFEQWHKGAMNWKLVLKTFTIVLVLFSLLLTYFAWMQNSRAANKNYEIEDYVIGDIAIQKPEGSLDGLGRPSSGSELTGFRKKLNDLWISASSYLSQGYYGMSQALTVEWTPMFGVGNSMFLVNLISGNIYDVDQFTYQAKLEPFGWDSDVRWHSIYTWLANDVSFVGVIVVMLLIGAVFGMMFRDAILNKNPFAQASIFYFILMVLFIPCNNQVGQGAETYLSFLLLIGLWLLSKPAAEAHDKKG